MKQFFINKSNLLVFTLLLVIPICIFAQNEPKSPKVKSIIVFDEEFSKDSKGSLRDSETYYDISGNVIEEKEYKNGEFKSHLKNEYDSNNNKTKISEFDSSGKLIKSTVYKYEKNLKTEKLVYDSKSKLLSKKTYSYKFY